MTEDQFVKSRQVDWKDFESQLSALKNNRRHSGAVQFPTHYRRLCQDLNQARACSFSAATIEQLNHLVWEGHQHLYHKSTVSRIELARTILVDFPARVRRELAMVLVGHLLFYGLGILVFFYITAHPDSINLFLNLDEQSKLGAMYDPQAEHFLKPRDVNGNADMFGFYILNNIGIGFRTFAGGALCGIGSLFFLGFNALNLGASSAYIVKSGLGSTFFPFVVTHSAFELTALILFAVAGLRIGWAWIAPGRLDRRSAFGARAREMIPIIAGSICFLVIAAILEAFWSSQILPATTKYLTGGICWTLVGLFLWLGGRRRGE